MILTVTLNSAIDQVLLLEELDLGRPVQARKAITCVGGKGLDVSVALSGLGVPSTGLAFLAGKNGKLLEEIVLSYGIVLEPVWVGGETRICYVISETAHGRVSHVKVGGLEIHPPQLQELSQSFSRLARSSSWIVIAGSIPPGVSPEIYQELIAVANRDQTPVLLDTSGEAVCYALKSKPAIIKMNRDEFSSTFGVSAPTLNDLCFSAFQVWSQHQIQSLVITSGAEGILALTPQGIYRLLVPPQSSVNPAGAGDAASAALAWRLESGDSWAEALKWAGAASAAAVLTEATGEVDKQTAENLLPFITLEEILIS